MSRKKYKHIIWDWNGTLLDDVDIVIDAMNNLLRRRGLPLINRESYRQIFTFPVKDYYARLGFDFSNEPYEKLADEFTAEINSDKYCYKLFPEVEGILQNINDQAEHAKQLAALLTNRLAHVNLIPFNAVPELGLKPSPRNVVDEFARILKKKMINVTVRRRLGADIAAACGQLRNNLCMENSE